MPWISDLQEIIHVSSWHSPQQMLNIICPYGIERGNPSLNLKSLGLQKNKPS